MRVSSTLSSEVFTRLEALPKIDVRRDVPLIGYNRFGIGGEAAALAETVDPEALAAAWAVCRENDYPFYLLGDGSNIIVSDAGYAGLALRYTPKRLEERFGRITAQVGAPLQALVDFTIEHARSGLHTLERIPGSVGGAVYGNAGAYGHSIDESIVEVEALVEGGLCVFDNAACAFEYRESVFKKHKDWLILSCSLEMPEGDPVVMRAEADKIRGVRDAKFPPTMRCAGSIFKNLYFADLPAAAQAAVPESNVRGGKVASAFFLERVGAKDMRQGGIHITPYHANIIYNEGGGTAADLRTLILELKKRVREEYGFEVEEEVQYVGDFRPAG